MRNTIETRRYTHYVSGEIGGATSATQMPDIDCSLVWFKAKNGNSTFAYIGGPGVTKPDATTDTTTGWELDAAEEIGPLPCSNLNVFWYICDATGDEILYLAAK